MKKEQDVVENNRITSAKMDIIKENMDKSPEELRELAQLPIPEIKLIQESIQNDYYSEDNVERGSGGRYKKYIFSDEEKKWIRNNSHVEDRCLYYNHGVIKKMYEDFKDEFHDGQKVDKLSYRTFQRKIRDYMK